MKAKHIVIITLLAIAALAVLPVAVAADSSSAPQLPAQIYGTVVDKDGVPLPVGTVITATVDGREFTYTVTEEGKIGEPGTFGEKFLVHGENAGSKIEFSVNGETAGELTSYTPGKSMEFDLSFPVDADDLKSGDSSPTPSVPSENPDKEQDNKPTESNPSMNPSDSTQSPSETQGDTVTDLPGDDEQTDILPPVGDTGDSPVETVPPLDDVEYPTDVQTPGLSFELIIGAFALAAVLKRKEE